MKIAFVGGGAMGEAMLSAIIEKGLTAPDRITVSDIADVRREHLRQKYGVAVVSDNRLAVEAGEVIVLAIKPQNLALVMAELTGRLQPGQLVISIIAGARINSLSLGLDHGSIIRVMPNTPAQIGEGISVWTATPQVTEQQRGWAASILGTMGKEIYVGDERFIDMATAVSGSGPAYIFLVIESLIEAAAQIGLPRDIGQELVLQTLVGSGHFVQKSGKPPAELRKMVTSPGGTTAAALGKLEEGGFSELLKQAVIAAYNRARELGG